MSPFNSSLLDCVILHHTWRIQTDAAMLYHLFSSVLIFECICAHTGAACVHTRPDQDVVLIKAPLRQTLCSVSDANVAPEEFFKWIYTCNQPPGRCSIRFLYDWWTCSTGSCILLGLIELHYRGNWLLCYGMHIGKLSNYLEPGCPLYSQTRYRITLMKSLMAVSSMTGNDSLHLSLFWSWKLHHQGFLKYVQDLDAVWYSWSALAQYTSRRRFFKIL